jgi:hypothetical protein
MTARTLVEQVLADVGGDRWLDEHRVQRLAELQSVYEANDVLGDGVAPALHRGCPSRDACWETIGHRRPKVVPASKGPGEYGCIFWPWIGRDYRRRGVCLVTTNINASEEGWWSIGEEYGIAEVVLNAFGEGDPRPFGREFFWKLLSTANAVLTSLDGGRPTARLQSTVDAAAALERVCRVQAIKCSPLGVASSELPGVMSRTCPPRFALPEIEVLKPGVLVALGYPAAFGTAQGLCDGGPDWTEHERFMRGRANGARGAMDVLWLNHPSARHGEWDEGQALLVQSLIDAPLTPRNGG